MELDDFKKKKWSENQPENDFETNQNISADQFIETFKANIKNQRRLSFFFITILLSLSVIYISRINKGNNVLDIGYGLITTGFIIGAIYIYLRSRPFPDSFYSFSMADFLNQAEKRLKFMNFTDWLVIIPLLIILGVGGGIVFINRLLNYTANFYLLLSVWILFFLCLSIFGFYASKKDWEKKYGTLLNEISSFKKSLL